MTIRILWLKQKMVGLLMVLLPLIFWDTLVKYDVAIIVVMYLPIGLYYLFTKRRLYSKDYIFEYPIDRE